MLNSLAHTIHSLYSCRFSSKTNVVASRQFVYSWSEDAMTAHVRNLLLCEPTPITYVYSIPITPISQCPHNCYVLQGGLGGTSRCIGMVECAQVQDEPLWHQLLPLATCVGRTCTRCILSKAIRRYREFVGNEQEIPRYNVTSRCEYVKKQVMFTNADSF